MTSLMCQDEDHVMTLQGEKPSLRDSEEARGTKPGSPLLKNSQLLILQTCYTNFDDIICSQENRCNPYVIFTQGHKHRCSCCKTRQHKRRCSGDPQNLTAWAGCKQLQPPRRRLYPVLVYLYTRYTDTSTAVHDAKLFC